MGNPTGEAANSGVLRSVPMVCGLAVAGIVLAIVPYRVAEEGYLNHVSGAWAALADDVAHGVFYRPLLSDSGYGGTRDFPLHFFLHGLLAAAGMPLRFSGHLISLGAAAILVAAGVIAFQRRGVAPPGALALGVLVLASRTAIMGAAGIRGDLLPVALGVLGLALVPRSRDESPFPTGVLLSLALLAKPTLIWAPAGAFFALTANRQWRLAFELSAIVAVLTGGGLFAVQSISHGSMTASFAACGSGGGFSRAVLLNALTFVRPGDLAWALGGAAMTLWRGRKALTDPLCVAGLVCLPVTVFVLTSQGTHVNHLVDSSVLGALALGIAVIQPDARLWPRAFLAVATVLGILEIAMPTNMYTRRSELEQAAAALPSGSGPVLSEQPWIPLLAGERAFAIDAYSLWQTRRSSPALNRDFLASLDTCRFRAIVLLGRADRSPWWYDQTQFGEGFREHLAANYVFHGVIGAYAFYLPRCGSASAVPDEGNTETVLDRMQASGSLHLVLTKLGLR